MNKLGVSPLEALHTSPSSSVRGDILCSLVLVPCTPCTINTKRVLPMESFSFFPWGPFAWIPVWLCTCVNGPSSSVRITAISPKDHFLPSESHATLRLSHPWKSFFNHLARSSRLSAACCFYLFINLLIGCRRTKGASFHRASYLRKEGIQHRLDTQVLLNGWLWLMCHSHHWADDRTHPWCWLLQKPRRQNGQVIFTSFVRNCYNSLILVTEKDHIKINIKGFHF